MASKFLVIALVVMLVGSAFAMFDLNDADIENGYAVDEGYAEDDGYALDQLMDELHPMLAVKRDANRAKASKKYKMCHPVRGSNQECWCFRKSGAIFYCFGASNGK